MNILITQRHSKNAYGDWIDSLENSYVRYFGALGLNLYPVPNATGNPERFFESISPGGIILSGGGDVSPGLYCGLTRDDDSAEQRDITEAKLLKYAISHKIPVLGICRGMQFLNVFFGGRLIPDIGSEDPEGLHRSPSSHSLKVVHEGLTALLGERTGFETNSYHIQGLRREDLGREILPFAVFEGLGLVEGIFHLRYPFAGIQWHPERPGAPEDLDSVLIRCFMKRELFWSSEK